MKKALLILVSALFLFSCESKYKTEKELEKCFFKSLEDKKDDVKGHINKYEQFLISKKILKDQFQESYYDIFEK